MALIPVNNTPPIVAQNTGFQGLSDPRKRISALRSIQPMPGEFPQGFNNQINRGGNLNQSMPIGGQQGLIPPRGLDVTQTPGINDANLPQLNATQQFNQVNSGSNQLIPFERNQVIPPGVNQLQQRITGGVKPPKQINQAQPLQQQSQQQVQPQFGLSGAEQALQAGANAGVNAIGQGNVQALGSLQFGNQLAQNQLQQGVSALGGNFSAQAANVNPLTGQPLFQQAAQGVGAFSGAGLQAQDLQSALSGAQGQEAFNQALVNSPQQAFINQLGNEAVINQAAATGGVGGGEVLRDLQQLGQARASQQVQQQIQNLQNLSGQGLQAAGLQGQFLGQAGQQQGNLASQNAQLSTQANLSNARNALQAAGQQAQLFGQGASIGSNLAAQGAGFNFNAGQNVANLLSGTGQNIADARFQTGRDLASQIGQSTSALSNLANQQGSGLADIFGAGGSNLANLLSGSGQFDANQQAQLAQMLANISVGQGTQLSNIALGQGNNAANAALREGANQQELVGNLAGAFGTFVGGQTPPPQTTPQV